MHVDIATRKIGAQYYQIELMIVNHWHFYTRVLTVLSSALLFQFVSINCDEGDTGHFFPF